MTRLPPFTLTVYDKAFQRVGTVPRPLSLSGAVRVGAPGELMFTVDDDAPRTAALMADGARVRCDYRWSRGSDLAEPLPLISGTVGLASGTSARRVGTRTFTITDDFQLFADMLGWPNPTGTISQQGADSTYYSRTGSAETVAIQHLQAIVTRMQLPVVLPASQGRGSSITVKMRMHTALERLLPAIQAAGLNLRLIQLDEAGVTLQVQQPAVHTRVLTQASGVVTAGSFQVQPPAVTRIVIGAGGEGQARIFRQYVRADWETQYGTSTRRFRRERFIDARDIGLEEGATALTAAQETELQQRADEMFEESGPRGSLSATLAETTNFRFGKTYMLGDKVALQLTNSPALADYVREVAFSWDTDTGPVITPKVGDWAESVNARILKSIASTMRTVSNMQKGI